MGFTVSLTTQENHTMNTKDLYKKAKLAIKDINPLIDTPQMRQTIMLSVVSQWIFDVEPFVNDRDISESILKTASETIALIYQE
jgi:hypothetical protein